MYYVLDTSGSMSEPYEGGTSKLEAAKQSIINTNGLLASFNNGSRSGVITFYGAATGSGSPPVNTTYNTIRSVLTTNFTNVNNSLTNVVAGGSTSTSHALKFAAARMLQENTTGRVPVIILLSDGVPTINLRSYTTNVNAQNQNLGFGYSFVDSDVVTVTVRLTDTVAAVRERGTRYAQYDYDQFDEYDRDYYSGDPLADVMQVILDAKVAQPSLTVHTVAIEGGSIFNASVLEYVANRGEGIFANANNLNELNTSLANAIRNSQCGGAPRPGPAPASVASSRWTPTPTAARQTPLPVTDIRIVGRR